jgi:hypothetical protein
MPPHQFGEGFFGTVGGEAVEQGGVIHHGLFIVIVPAGPETAQNVFRGGSLSAMGNQ